MSEDKKKETKKSKEENTSENVNGVDINLTEIIEKVTSDPDYAQYKTISFNNIDSLGGFTPEQVEKLKELPEKMHSALDSLGDNFMSGMEDKLNTFSSMLGVDGINSSSIPGDKMDKVENIFQKMMSLFNNDTGETGKVMESMLGFIKSDPFCSQIYDTIDSTFKTLPKEIDEDVINMLEDGETKDDILSMLEDEDEENEEKEKPEE